MDKTLDKARRVSSSGSVADGFHNAYDGAGKTATVPGPWSSW